MLLVLVLVETQVTKQIILFSSCLALELKFFRGHRHLERQHRPEGDAFSCRWRLWRRWHEVDANLRESSHIT